MLSLDPSWGRTFFRGLIIAIIAGGCGGGGCDGCGGMTPLPGGFPAESRSANAIQLRITDSALATLEEDPAALVGPLLGQEGLSIDIPPSCGSDPEICCEGGVPADSCGPLDIDLEAQNGDLPRLEITPVAGSQRLDVTIRTRITSAAPIPVSYSGVDCDISVDTAGGSRDGITLTMDIELPQDPDEQTTRLEVGDITVDFQDDDITIDGGFFCDGIDSFLKGFIVDLLSDNISSLLGGSLGEQACIPCESGTTLECGAFADSCEENVCMIGDRCEQRLGISGRMTAGGLFGGFSTGQLGNLDIYDVAGGYTETDTNGVSIGMYSGALPFAEPRDRCGPSVPAPATVTIPQSTFFSGNTRPDTNAPFHVGIGVHQQVLDQLAHAAYESGALCLNIAPGAVDLLNTDGLAPLLMPSVLDLLHGKNSPIVLGLRPQSPPTLQIGAGTTMEGPGGETVIVDPLLDVAFEDIEIDFFVIVDDQFIRVMTLSADINLPMNLEINEIGEIEPVLGDVDNAITDTRISNSEALRETTEELEAKIPVLLSLALPSLLDGLGSFALPSLGGLDIQIADDGILSVEDNAFLAIYADLVLETTMARVHTDASVSISYGEDAPVATLRMSGDKSNLEYAYRVDGGVWSPYTRSSEVSLRRQLLAIAGEHTISVRAREQGRPMSTDLTPVVLKANIEGKPGQTYFHGNSGGGGCDCDSSGSSSTGWLAALVLLVLMRRPRRYAKYLAMVGLVALSGCSCGSDPSGPQCAEKCLEGEVERGPIGRYSSIAAGDGRVVAAAYDENLGDLVVIERDEEGALSYRAIAGIPNELPIYEPDTYRNGIAGDGPDKGLWSSIVIHDGRLHVAFVDAEDGSVNITREQDDGSFRPEVVDADAGISGASYLSLSISSTGVASIAYLAHGVASAEHDGLLSELRVADGSASWATEIVDVGPISCAGLCGDADVCVNTGSIEECKAPSGTCGEGCSDTEACVEDACLALIEAGPDGQMLDGVGLFAQLVQLPNGTRVLGYYDGILGDVKLATNTGSGFVAGPSLEGPLDVGMWLSMVAAENNAVHMAFQDANGDRLMYARFEDGILSEPEFADDGVRTGDDRTHPVGASAAIGLRRDRAPMITYQDGLTSDVELAIREQGSWSRTTLMEGPRLDGFFIDAATADGEVWMSHYFYDRSVQPMGELEIVILAQ
tara:strand:- start:8561 stop:12121 length:3561 start_codon:yes stop_codon:yes gene_type:complete